MVPSDEAPEAAPTLHWCVVRGEAWRERMDCAMSYGAVHHRVSPTTTLQRSPPVRWVTLQPS